MSKMKNPFLKFLKHLQPLFTLPNSIEESQKQTETLLTVYIWAFITIMTMGCIVLMAFDPSQIQRPLTIIIVINTLYLSLYVLMKRGRVHLANILIIGITWILLTVAVLTGGGFIHQRLVDI